MRKIFYITIFSLFLLLNAFLVWATIDVYYDFFIKDCYDIFPFHYCPWGAESMGWRWRSANAYMDYLIRHFVVVCTFSGLSIYNLYRKKYRLAILLMVLPSVILFLWTWIESLLFY